MKKHSLKIDATKRSALKSSLLVTAIYIFVGYLWIILTDTLVANNIPESLAVLKLSIFKGLLFVTGSAILIFILVFNNLIKVYHESDVRKKSESALQEAQLLAHIGSFSFDSETLLMDYSEEARRIFNLSEKKPTPTFRTLLRKIDPKDRETVKHFIEKVLSQECKVNFICRVLQPDAMERTISVQIQSVSKNDAKAKSIVGAIQDITDLVMAKSAARENEAIFKTLINASHDLVYLKDSSLRYIATNTNMQRYYGIQEDQLIGRTISELKPGTNSDTWEMRDKKVLETGKPVYVEENHTNGYFETIIFPVDLTGGKRGVGGISRDITARRQSEAAVELERKRAQTYFEAASVMFVALDQNGVILLINRSGCEKLQLQKDEIVGQNWIERFVPSEQQKDIQLLLQELQSDTSEHQYQIEYDIISARDSVRRMEWRIAGLKNAEGTYSGALLTGLDVTELRQTLNALQESERSKSVLLSNLPGMAYSCSLDEKRTMHFVSKGCQEITGYTPEELTKEGGISFCELICPEYRGIYLRTSKENAKKKTSYHYEYEIQQSSGERKWVLDINQGIARGDDEVSSLEGIVIDITESKLQFLQIQFLSDHDQLTGLFNRQHYDSVKKDYDSEKYFPLSVMYADISGLKFINDAFGYTAGDEMIQRTATILKRSIRPNDVLARIGGDEFGILLPNTSARECAKRTQSIQAALDEYNKTVYNRAYIINLSIGCDTKTTAEQNLIAIESEAEANMTRKKLFDTKSHHNAVLSSIMATLFERSYETEEHAKRIGKLCEVIGKRLGLIQSDIDMLRLFAILHDVGKIGISDQILNKKTALTEEEWDIMRTHPEIGYRIAMVSPDFAPVAELILTHHERWDGNGYPNHVAGEDIPLLSRILAVSDAYDAMTMDRVYRKGLSKEAAIQEIQDNAGTQFDPHIAEVFLEIIQETDL